MTNMTTTWPMCGGFLWYPHISVYLEKCTCGQNVVCPVCAQGSRNLPCNCDGISHSHPHQNHDVIKRELKQRQIDYITKL